MLIKHYFPLLKMGLRYVRYRPVSDKRVVSYAVLIAGILNR